MRTTLDLPDPVFRRLKARAALEGLSLKDLIGRYVAAGLRRSDAAASSGEGRVSEPATEPITEPATRAPRFVSAWDVMQDGSGLAQSGKRDLATNPAHMEGFGRD